MADPLGYPDSEPRTTRRWLKAVGIVALVLVLLIVVMVLVGGGEHGPGRHTGSGGSGGQAVPASVTQEHGPPVGGHSPR